MTYSGDCAGNCGTDLGSCDGYYTVMTPQVEDLDFCSLACMSSWLDAERVSFT